jgi:hypothetical protein
MTVINARCDQCRFWQRTDLRYQHWTHPDDWEGKCLRYPPVLNSAYLAYQGSDDEDALIDLACTSIPWFWPLTDGARWCGEFVQKTSAARDSSVNDTAIASYLCKKKTRQVT